MAAPFWLLAATSGLCAPSLRTVCTPALHTARAPARPCAQMCDAESAKEAWLAKITPPDVESAAEAAAALLREEKAAVLDAKLDALWGAPSGIEGENTDGMQYLDTRETLVGEVSSSELLAMDEEAGMWPEANLPMGDRETDKTMLWVDELSVASQGLKRPYSSPTLPAHLSLNVVASADALPCRTRSASAAAGVRT